MGDFQVRRLRFSGEVDIARRDEIRRLLESAAAAHAVLIDLSGATYLDSVFLAELFRFERERRESGRVASAIVVPPTARIVRVLDITGVHRAIPIFDDEASALAHLNPNDS